MQFKKLVKNLIHQRKKEELLEKAKRYKKISRESLAQEDFGVHLYFKTLSVSQARLRLKLHARMTPRVAACFPSDCRFKEQQLQCLACSQAGIAASLESTDTEEHIMSCSFYADLRDDLDLETDMGLVTFFQRVIERRAEYDDS